jgi:ferritin-like metal-binding protein YciE
MKANKPRDVISINQTESLHQGFMERLGEMHDAEKKLAKALWLVEKAAKSKDLKTVVKAHRKETEGHVECIEHVALSLDEKLPKKTSRTMDSLLKETVGLILRKRKSPTRDAEIIAEAQRIEHFEISSYRTLCGWAKEMDYTHELALLASILDQEILAETLLGEMAHSVEPLDVLVRRVILGKAKEPAAV